MFKSGLAAALFVTAAVAVAQPAQQPPAPPQMPEGTPPELASAGEAFGMCIGEGIQGLAATIAAEAGADMVLAGCATQQATLMRLIEATISSSPMSAEQKAAAQGQVQAQFAQAKTQVADGIRQARAARAAAPAAAPANPAN
jgi:hypothetical protein